MDDTILNSETPEQHEEYAEEFFKIIHKAGLKVSPNKCKILQEKVEFLGHVISHNSIKNDPAKAQCIKDMSIPVIIKDLQSALGTFDHQREFIKDCQIIANPLYSLIKLKNVPEKFRKKNGAVNGKLVKVVWTPETIESFNQLKDACSQNLELAMPDFSLPLNLHTDACKYACGAYLSQTNEVGEEKIIGFFSKSFTSAQRNYGGSEQEWLAVILAIEFFHIYL
jgi:hypothetical protein